MKKLLTIIVIILLIIVAVLFTNKNSSESPDVMTSIYPIYSLTTKLTSGTSIKTGLILPPGASPHTFEPTPSKVRDINSSKLVFYIGHQLDDWAVENISNTDTDLVILDKNIELLANKEYEEEHEDHDADHEHEDHEDHDADHEHEDHEDHDADHEYEEEHEDHDADSEEEHEHEHGPIDPHYWLDIENAMIMSSTIADELSTKFPESKTQIQDNLQTLLGDLGALDTEITTILSQVENKEIITLHEAWYYFAKDYGLNVIATFEPSPGKEPTAQYLKELTETVAEHGLTTIYSEAQLNTAPLKALVADNNLKIAELDPLGGVEGRESYLDLMLYNANTIANNQ